MRSLFNTVKENIEDTTYTKRVNIPQYLPNDSKPELKELYNVKKYGELLHSINMSNVSEDDKQFLRLAASRHIVFNYAKIADYYAHAEPEMQRLMEESALVILDVDDAISYGYAKFSSRVAKMLEESGEKPNE